MMSALPLASAPLKMLCIPFLNHLLDPDLCKNVLDFHILFSSGFQSWCYIHWFYLHCSFNHSNWWRHKLGHT